MSVPLLLICLINNKIIMKKIFFVVALVAAFVMGANAQNFKYVSPVTLELLSFNLDSLRAQSGDNLDVYLTALSSLQNELNEESKRISDVEAQWKLESKLYDEMYSSVKERKSQVEKEKSFFSDEIKKYDSQISNIKAEFAIIHKMKDIQAESVQNHVAMLNELEKRCNEGKDRSNRILDIINNTDCTELDAAFAVLKDFSAELAIKNTSIVALSNENKVHLTNVKERIKAVKAEKKAKK